MCGDFQSFASKLCWAAQRNALFAGCVVVGHHITQRANTHPFLRACRCARMWLDNRSQIPRIDYNEDETKTWGLVYSRLMEMSKKHACREYLDIMPQMERSVDLRCGDHQVSCDVPVVCPLSSQCSTTRLPRLRFVRSLSRLCWVLQCTAHHYITELRVSGTAATPRTTFRSCKISRTTWLKRPASPCDPSKASFRSETF